MKAIRILQANWLNDEISGDANTIRLVRDEMAYDAVEVHHLAEYAPEYDQGPTFVGPDAAAKRLEELKAKAAAYETPVVEQPVIDTPTVEYVSPDTSAETAPEMTQPWTTASKATWIEWAVHQGADATEAAALTKSELMSRYGERL